MPDAPKKPDLRPPGVNFEDRTITFDYIKGQCFRVIHVDGAQGGVGPRGLIQVAVFSERWPIPQKSTHAFDQNTAKLGEEIVSKRVSRDAVVREVEAELIMTPETAMIIAEWLKTKVKEGKEKKEAKQSGKEEPHA